MHRLNECAVCVTALLASDQREPARSRYPPDEKCTIARGQYTDVFWLVLEAFLGLIFDLIHDLTLDVRHEAAN